MLPEGKGGMAAAVVELNALADPVGAAAQDEDLLAATGLRLGEAVVGGVHVGGLRLELGRACVDALVRGHHPKLLALAAHLQRLHACEMWENIPCGRWKRWAPKPLPPCMHLDIQKCHSVAMNGHT